MKTSILPIVLGVFIALTGTSCMTTYDAYGRPVQSVDPGMAALGVAAAGVAGYAIGQNNEDHDDHHHRHYRHHYHGH